MTFVLKYFDIIRPHTFKDNSTCCMTTNNFNMDPRIKDIGISTLQQILTNTTGYAHKWP